MKPLRVFFLICNLLFLSSLAVSQEFLIETSRGIQRVVVPANMTIEDAYLTMAQLYLEERFDHEETLSSVESLTQSVEEYVAEVQKLNEEVDNLQSDNATLISMLEESNKTDNMSILGSISLGTQQDRSYYGQAAFGVLLFEQWTVQGEVSTPLRFGIRIGRIF